MIFKVPPYKANELLTHLTWIHNNGNIFIASFCEIVYETLFLEKNLLW
jgi:hypothetical protein